MHYKTICKYCDKVLGQCRCPSKDKEICYVECPDCHKKKLESENQND